MSDNELKPQLENILNYKVDVTMEYDKYLGEHEETLFEIFDSNQSINLIAPTGSG